MPHLTLAIALSLPLLTILASGAPLPGAAGASQARDPEVEFRQIAKLLELDTGTVVADVGAGGGEWTFRLAARVGPKGRVYATDVKTAQAEGLRRGAAARRADHVTVVLGTQQDMALPPACCDAMLLRLVYHAFDDAGSMREGLRQAMRPGGLVLVIDFRPPVDQLTRDMRDAGFERSQHIERWQGQEGVFAALFRKPR